MGITLNTASNDEHVDDIERQIRTIKERCKSIYNTLPFHKMPARLVIEMVYASVFWLNSFAPNDGVSKFMSPRTIVTGLQVEFNRHCQLEFGTYTQVHEEHDNSMDSRTAGATALRPTGNAQGGYYFMSISTGRRLNRNNWSILPMPNEVIERVHNLARRQSANKGLLFMDREGNDMGDDLIGEPMDDGDSDGSTYAPSENDSGNDSDTEANNYERDEVNGEQNDIPPDVAGDIMQVDAEIPDMLELQDNNFNDELEDAPQGQIDVVQQQGINELAPCPNIIENYPGDPVHDFVENLNNRDFAAEYNEQMPPDDDIVAEDIDENEDNYVDIVIKDIQNEQIPEIYGAAAPANAPAYLRNLRNHDHHLRPRRPQNYNFLHVATHQAEQEFMSTLLTQFSMKRGIKEYGKPGVDAVLKELKHLHDRKVIIPEDASKMTRTPKRAALAYLMFLKKKRTGQIKGRGCADGRKQRLYTKKEEASSPTVSIEALMISCMIDAEEGREVATIDIPGAFMQADMDYICG